MSSKAKRAILLMNLGSPDSTEHKDVRNYLNEFLMDKRVIDSSYVVRSILVKGIIVPFRTAKSAHAYKSVWTEEGSPLIMITRQLQAALQEKTDDAVFIAMRYGNPSVKAAFDTIAKQYRHVEEVILVPLYPHYAMSSYETAVVYAWEVYKKYKYNFRIRTIKPFYDNKDYIHAMVENMRPYVSTPFDHILFSYHGLPERHIKKSDTTGCHCLMADNCCEVASPAHATCYRHQAIVTMNQVADALQLPKEKYSLSFQSRLGRDPWLQPFTVSRLTELPAKGVKNILVVCPAFVSDCLETLEEMAIQGKQTFLDAGGESFTLIPCMNAHPQWVQTLACWMQQIATGNEEMLLTDQQYV